MKSRLLLLFLFPFLLQAQVVSVQKIDSFSVADIQTILDNIGAGGFITPQYEVDFYRVNYMTEFLDSMVEVSGALFVPRATACPGPLVAYHHGTVARKDNVPSFFSAEGQLSLMIATEGNVAVAADYIGLGESTVRMHPYIHSFSQAHSTINLLRAARDLEDSLNINMSNQLMLLGYSQGGHATMATHKYIQELYSDEFTVTASAPMSGPYDVVGEQAEVLVSTDPYPTPGYLPYVILSYLQMYPILFQDFELDEIFVPPYDTLMPNLFYNHTNGMGTINSQSTPVPRDMVVPAQLDSFVNDPNHPLQQALLDNTLLDWTPQAPVRLVYCNGDDQVTYRNSIVADSVWQANGAPAISSQDMGGSNHTDCVRLAILNARNFLYSFNNFGIDIQVDYDAASGSFILSLPDDDISLYDVRWGDGETTPTLNDVETGQLYTVTVTSPSGCSASKDFTVEDVINSIDDAPDYSTLVSVYPNPTSGRISFQLPEGKGLSSVSIYSLSGQQLLTLPRVESETIHLGEFASGYYILRGQLKDGGVFTKRVVLE